jgi:EAL domain-containing protein (putative c-di-GMP-specific phosphodiesterase class I)
MYQAKAAGRGTLRFFDPAMQAARDLRESLEVDLRRAVAQGQLRLHYQAQVDANRRIVGVEALLRWHHPRQGILLPDMFLPLAEQTGLILGIGDWVVEQACAQLAAWARRPASRGLRLSVNVSARQFRHEEFTAHLDTALRRHGAVPQRLRLEVRETVLQADPVVALARMNAARQLGVGFAIDGFGISLSSISHLRRLPIEQIKISPALISTLPDDAHDEAVVRTIVCIARELRLATLACGVETEDQRGCLEAMGCLNWQGHLFGHPVPLAEFEARLQALHVITGSASRDRRAAAEACRVVDTHTCEQVEKRLPPRRRAAPSSTGVTPGPGSWATWPTTNTPVGAASRSGQGGGRSSGRTGASPCPGLGGRRRQGYFSATPCAAMARSCLA